MSVGYLFPRPIINTPFYYFKGKIDDARIFSRSLFDEEVSLLYKDRIRKPPSPRIDSVFLIGYDFAKVQSTFDFYEGDDIFNYGICWSKMPNPDTSNYVLTGDNLFKISHLDPGATYYVRSFAINSIGIGYSSEVNFTTAYVDFDTIADIEGNLYRTVKIGNQTWMADNLRTKTYPNGEPIKYGHDSIPYVRGKYYFIIPHMPQNGCYYTWAAATNSDSLYNTFPNGIQGVCPDDWHIPNRNDFSVLMSYLGGPPNAGYKMCMPGEIEGEDYWISGSKNTNASGFSAKGVGIKFNYEGMNYNFDGYAEYTGFWTSESDAPIPPIPEYGIDYWLYKSYSLLIYYSSPYLYSTDSFWGLSVRCIKDTTSLPPENMSKKTASADSSLYGVYPNPAVDVLYLDNIPEKVTITIYDAQSRIRLKTMISNGQVNISSLPKGIYFIQISDGAHSQKKKFVK
jgi:uncharacterized protein (TIGR02145 family)